MSLGGNAGTASWIIAHALLRRGNIALIGIDLGYPADMPLEQTIYYNRMLQQTNGNTISLQALYKTIHNPFFNTDSTIDPVFEYYRMGFLSLMKECPDWVNTTQCSKGTLFFEDKPDCGCMEFVDWLDKYGKK